MGGDSGGGGDGVFFQRVSFVSFRKRASGVYWLDSVFCWLACFFFFFFFFLYGVIRDYSVFFFSDSFVGSFFYLPFIARFVG